MVFICSPSLRLLLAVLFAVAVWKSGGCGTDNRKVWVQSSLPAVSGWYTRTNSARHYRKQILNATFRLTLDALRDDGEQGARRPAVAVASFSVTYKDDGNVTVYRFSEEQTVHLELTCSDDLNACRCKSLRIEGLESRGSNGVYNLDNSSDNSTDNGTENDTNYTTITHGSDADDIKWVMLVRGGRTDYVGDYSVGGDAADDGIVIDVAAAVDDDVDLDYDVGVEINGTVDVGVKGTLEEVRPTFAEASNQTWSFSYAYRTLDHHHRSRPRQQLLQQRRHNSLYPDPMRGRKYLPRYGDATDIRNIRKPTKSYQQKRFSISDLPSPFGKPMKNFAQQKMRDRDDFSIPSKHSSTSRKLKSGFGRTSSSGFRWETLTVRLQKDEALDAWTLIGVEEEELLAMSDSSTLCPTESSGLWFQLVRNADTIPPPHQQQPFFPNYNQRSASTADGQMDHLTLAPNIKTDRLEVVVVMNGTLVTKYELKRTNISLTCVDDE